MNSKANDAMVDCQYVFDAPSAEMLAGFGTVWCRARDRKLYIMPGYGSVVAVGRTISLDSSQWQISSKADWTPFASTSVEIAGPLDAESPEVSLFGPEVVGTTCGGGLTKVAIKSKVGNNPSGKPVKLTWEIIEAPEDSKVHVESLAAESTSQSTKDLVLQSKKDVGRDVALAAGTYKLKVTAVNWAGREDSDTWTLVKEGSARPVVNIVGSSSAQAPRKFKFAERTSVVTFIDSDTVCDTSSVAFEWKQTYPSDRTISGLTLDKKNLKIPVRIPGVVVGEGCTHDPSAATPYSCSLAFEFTAALGSTSSAPTTVCLLPEASDLAARVTGPTYDFPSNMDMVLNASLSYDPDEPTASEGLSYAWTCMRLDGKGCFEKEVPVMSGPALTIPKGTLGGDGKQYYAFKLTLKKDTRQTESTLYVSVVPGVEGAPTGEIVCTSDINGLCRVPHNPSRDLEFFVELGYFDTAVAWSSPQIDLGKAGVTPRTGVNAPFLVVNNEFLDSGVEYTFDLNMTRTVDGQEIKRQAKQTVTMHNAPTCAPGTDCVTITPESGFELGNTVFIKRRTAFQRSQFDNVELKYLSRGSHLLYACAIDSVGSKACREATVEVKEIVVEQTAAAVYDLYSSISNTEAMGDSAATAAEAF